MSNTINFRKIFGWILLFLGIAVIIYSLYSSFNIFTGKTAVPELFKMTEQETSLSQKGETQDLQGQMEKMIGEQLKGILPVDFISKLFNLIAWSIIAGILIFGGFQIANIGVKLTKE
ncbi:hypothetical protein ACFL0A_00375 [Patescibacteria group bacterium]